ncbi:MAG: DUF1385 domain-containing protein [Anaerolineae bacterium]
MRACEQDSNQFNYGGQAVLEGVMMRGQKVVAVAVRDPSGQIVLHSELIAGWIHSGRWSKIPFLRGLVLLWDTLALGIRSLIFSANVALAEEEEVEFGGPVVWTTLVVSLLFVIGLFFTVPLLITSLIEPYIPSSLVINILEGLLRLLLFLAYLAGVGLLPDIKRVFAYHGAEHKTINAYEAGVPLDPHLVQNYSTSHSRCGTGFLLVVMVLAILIFAFLGRPPLLLRFLSRILLIPLIASLSYEIIRFGAAHHSNPLLRVALAPSLALQSLSTREPDESMLEVAIAALKKVLATEGLLAEKPQEGLEPGAVPAR